MEFGSVALSFLVNIAARSLGLALLAAAVMYLFRIRSAAARHAVWTVVAAGMLVAAMLSPVLPPVPVRVLRATPATPPVALPAVGGPVAAQPGGAPAGTAAGPSGVLSRFGWREGVVAIYAAGVLVFLIRLAFSYAFTRRLLRASRRIEQPWAAEAYESTWISVPLTVGWLRPKVLLPAGWADWSGEKLEAVLVHELAHVRRADWAISVLAGLNRCVYWFHPLAWWVERRLALLAEEACDDSALLLVGTESYAQALLEMAAAVKTGQGRLVWEAMAMAKASEVRRRIDLILDETRQIPKALTRVRWTALVAASVPLIYLASVTQLARVEAHPQSTGVVSQADTAVMEQRLAANPHDLGLRARLILAYFAGGVREPRLSHIYWLIANHPESQEAGAMSLGITPRPTSMNTAADYARAAELWKQQAATHSADPRVLANAGQFFSQPGGDFEEAEKLLIAARALESDDGMALRNLGRLYAMAILCTSGDPHFDNANFAFGQRVKARLESSTDRSLVIQTAMGIVGAAVKPPPGATLPPGALNLDEHPLLAPLVEWARGLMNQSGFATVPRNPLPPGVTFAPQTASTYPPAPEPVRKVEPVYPPLARQARISGLVHLRVVIAAGGTLQNLEVIGGHPLLIQAAIEAVKQWTWSPSAAGTYSLDVNFSLPDSGFRAALPAPQAALSTNPPAPEPVKKVQPVYPPLARQARISGTVRLSVVIAGDGTLQKVEVLGGHPLLVPATLEAVKQWVWSPSAAGTYSLAVPFSIADAGPAPPVPQGVYGGIVGSGPTKGSTGWRNIITKVDPVYPPAAKEAGIEGVVRVRITIGADGRVLTAEAIDGHPLLQAAAVEAVKQWVYEPPAPPATGAQVLGGVVTVPFVLDH